MILDNSCERCRSRYVVNEIGEDGFPVHPHHCNDCTKRCSKCSRVFLVIRFLPNKDSSGYRTWRDSGQLGILLGRENFIDECIQCKPFYLEVEPERIHASPIVAVPVDPLERLRELLKQM